MFAQLEQPTFRSGRVQSRRTRGVEDTEDGQLRPCQLIEHQRDALVR